MSSITIVEIDKVQEEFIRSYGNPNLKHATLCNDYEKDGPKNADILSKTISLQCLWLKRLYDTIFINFIKDYLIQT